jgi:molybdopterin-containing oxidoreductase family iron-sulfur binding subunit
MAYNRCVGTRYCGNNCPYKVRRFNYLEWHGHLDDKFGWYKDFPESRKLQFNPNVTVRMRGVMEKCTYCVQRIEEGRISAKRDGRELKDGDIKSACQQACPTQAIFFGDLNDPKSEVTSLAALDRNYKLLAEIGTRPRTSFLARIRNPNPKLKGNG